MLRWFRKKRPVEQFETQTGVAPSGEAATGNGDTFPLPGEKPNAEFTPLKMPLSSTTAIGADVVWSPQYAEKEEAPPRGYPNVEVRPRIAPATSTAFETRYSEPVALAPSQPWSMPTGPETMRLGEGRDEDLVLERDTGDAVAVATAPEVEVEPEVEAEPEAEVEEEVEEEVTAAPEVEAVEIEAAVVEEAPAVEEPRSFFARLRERLGRTTDTLVESVRSAINLHPKVDEDLLEQVEDILLQSDVGVATAQKIVNRMREQARREKVNEPEGVLALFKRSIAEILEANQRPANFAAAQPTIVLVVGVNGTGKTTTIGKIARELHAEGRKTMLVAADTFRAAAAQQLAIWAKRTGSAIVAQEEGADPASVVFEALESARRGPTPDVILIDTAGRLHTKTHLMEQLTKIVRIIKRHYPEAPHETVLVLDATTGQNAINQVRLFHEACELTGLIMTKLDGTAKGGVLIGCKDQFGLPVFKIGIGEGPLDLRDFDAGQFVEALFAGKD